MKKRIIFLSSLVLFLSLLVLFLASFLTMLKDHTDKSKEEIKSYLIIACKDFDGTNFEETALMLSAADSNLRITFIDKEGTVIYDSEYGFDVSNLDNHINRPELQNLGDIYTRNSDSLGYKMMYIADLDSGYYIRLAYEISVINNIATTYFEIGFVGILVILVAGVGMLYLASKQMMKPVNQSVSDLASLIEDKQNYTLKDVDDLPKIIAVLRKEIENHIYLLQSEKEKNQTILDSMEQGLILLSGEDIELINPAALKLFNVSLDTVLRKNYFYCIRDISLQKWLQSALKDKKTTDLTIEIDGRCYFFTISFPKTDWNQNRSIITFIDITTKQKMDQIKKDFFANASHELKSPLTTIIGYQQMITAGIIEDKNEIFEAAEKTLKEANRMNQIIIDMLELSNLEYQKDFEMVSTNIKTILDDVIERYHNKLNSKKIKLELNVEDVVKEVSVMQIDEIFSNLLDNAIKYNINNGKIKITLNSNCFSVEDTGIGISKEDQTRVFERFYRVDKAKSKQSGGTGLGLAIVKHICEHFGYKIELESILDKGTKISIYW